MTGEKLAGLAPELLDVSEKLSMRVRCANLDWLDLPNHSDDSIVGRKQLESSTSSTHTWLSLRFSRQGTAQPYESELLGLRATLFRQV